jgi:hypothetical protein
VKIIWTDLVVVVVVVVVFVKWSQCHIVFELLQDMSGANERPNQISHVFSELKMLIHLKTCLVSFMCIENLN